MKKKNNKKNKKTSLWIVTIAMLFITFSYLLFIQEGLAITNSSSGNPINISIHINNSDERGVMGSNSGFITEIMSNPSGKEPDNEWIEIILSDNIIESLKRNASLLYINDSSMKISKAKRLIGNKSMCRMKRIERNWQITIQFSDDQNDSSLDEESSSQNDSTLLNITSFNITLIWNGSMPLNLFDNSINSSNIEDIAYSVWILTSNKSSLIENISDNSSEKCFIIFDKLGNGLNNNGEHLEILFNKSIIDSIDFPKIDEGKVFSRQPFIYSNLSVLNLSNDSQFVLIGNDSFSIGSPSPGIDEYSEKIRYMINKTIYDLIYEFFILEGNNNYNDSGKGDGNNSSNEDGNKGSGEGIGDLELIIETSDFHDEKPINYDLNVVLNGSRCSKKCMEDNGLTLTYWIKKVVEIDNEEVKTVIAKSSYTTDNPGKKSFTPSTEGIYIIYARVDPVNISRRKIISYGFSEKNDGDHYIYETNSLWIKLKKGDFIISNNGRVFIKTKNREVWISRKDLCNGDYIIEFANYSLPLSKVLNCSLYREEPEISIRALMINESSLCIKTRQNISISRYNTFQEDLKESYNDYKCIDGFFYNQEYKLCHNNSCISIEIMLPISQTVRNSSDIYMLNNFQGYYITNISEVSEKSKRNKKNNSQSISKEEKRILSLKTDPFIVIGTLSVIGVSFSVFKHRKGV